VTLAISSLAWEPAQDDIVRASLRRRGVTGVELAPLKYWPLAPAVPATAAREYAARWTDAGVSIVALQAILFGLPELQLFGSSAQQRAFEDHMVGIAALCGDLNASVIVFGAPKNRLRGALTEEEAMARAAPLLRRIALAAHDRGCKLCVEPNPPRYGGDFVRTTSEAMRLVREVDHPGFALHLDAGALSIASENDEQIVAAANTAAHFHVSEIDLVPVGSGTVDHQRIGALLQQAGYARWSSIEMRPPAGQEDALILAIDRAIDVAREHYDG
jgi:D-psicose/D-tagatose/L-ribulose 3-epimerase